MKQPLVSIIIPTYNRAHLIGETLDSVLAQTYSNWECIVVDDGSLDNTSNLLHDYCRKDSRIQYHHRPKDRPKGANACRNYGFELSTGEYVNWFDSDDIMLPDFLKFKIESFKENGELNLVICSGYEVNSELKNRKGIFFFQTSNLFKDYVLWKLKILTPSVLFRKSYLLNKELFSMKILRGQETELFSRLFNRIEDSEFQIIDAKLFLYRQHSDSKTEENKFYSKKFAPSSTYVLFQNLERSLEIMDSELINSLFNSMIEFFYKSTLNNDRNISKIVLNRMISLSFQFSVIKGLELIIVGNFLYRFKIGAHRARKRWLNWTLI